MDLGPCSDDNFYDGIPPFIPNESLDEFLRFTDNELDTAIGSFGASEGFGDFDVPMLDNPILDELPLQPPLANMQHSPEPDDFKFDLWSSPPSSTLTTSSSNQSASSSTRTVDDELQFDPNMFMSFLNDAGDCKLGELTQENITMMPQRNTPSPTGSYTSSSGSSTSGVHSDASSSAFNDNYGDVKLSMAIKEESQESSGVAMEEPFVGPIPPPVVSIGMPLITIPAPPQSTVSPATILQPIQVVGNTVMPPVQTVTPVPVMATPAVTPQSTVKVKPTVKIVTTPANPQPQQQPQQSASPKMTSPSNSKPKTIFLSSNDFKTLMQKMNSTGAKGAKISGGLNSQMPKIIMKTANGKVVTANKPTILNVANAAANGGSGVAQKFVKAPLIIKQQHHQATRVMTASGVCSTPTRASLSCNNGEVTIYKGLMDEKMVKKQQRMIKNRESASLSRKKKKEYVVSLESRINDLEKENCTLKGENTSLRSQLVAFAQTCHCKHSNVSDFILSSLNVKVNNSIATVSTGNSCGGNVHRHHQHPAHHHVKIAPKPIGVGGKSIKQRMTAATVKKNVAVLFAMAFMVTLNVGSFQTYFNQNSLENAMETVAVEEAAPPLATANAGRRLLWVQSETEFNEKLNRSRREAELPPPPLHFLRPVNRTGSNALAAAEQHGKRSDPVAAAMGIKCDDAATLATNQTEENMRMAKKLHKWIDGNDYLNLSLHEKLDTDDDLKNPGGFKLTPDYLKMKPLELPLQGGQKRKLYIQQDSTMDYDTKDTNTNGKPTRFGPEHAAAGRHNSLELFKPQISEEYLRLFRGIKRQDDTFYVLSFNMDHILLPASAYNKSSRPKMSLMLPAGDPSLNGDIVLMQIDCEVMNTTELVLKSDMIPEKLKPQKFGANVHVNPNDMANNETRGGSGSSAGGSSKQQPPHAGHQLKRDRNGLLPSAASEQFKDKPPIRTYFMMGPRTQTGLKNRTKLSALKMAEHPEAMYPASAANSIDLVEDMPKRKRMDIKNSTLITKMRETVEGEDF